MEINWSDVGSWLKGNAGSGAALVGSLLTGNVPAAVASGISLVASATGEADPGKSLAALEADPQIKVKLQELANAESASIRKHLEEMARIDLEDKQSEQAETQKTVRAGDSSEDPFVRRTRPGQAWLSLSAAIGYVFFRETPDIYVLVALLTLPFSYAGLRQIDKIFGPTTKLTDLAKLVRK